MANYSIFVSKIQENNAYEIGRRNWEYTAKVLSLYTKQQTIWRWIKIILKYILLILGKPVLKSNFKGINDKSVGD